MSIVLQPPTLDQFVTDIRRITYFQPDGQPLGQWLLFTAKTWVAAWVAARNAAWNAARNAAWDAARVAARNAAWDAARVAARDAAWDAARDAAWDAAWNAARDAAWNAARDAALYAAVQIVCADLDIDTDLRAHVEARLEVWRKGYGLLCDIDGRLYVYAPTRLTGKQV
jgi:hypothetical protein